MDLMLISLLSMQLTTSSSMPMMMMTSMSYRRMLLRGQLSRSLSVVLIPVLAVLLLLSQLPMVMEMIHIIMILGRPFDAMQGIPYGLDVLLQQAVAQSLHAHPEGIAHDLGANINLTRDSREDEALVPLTASNELRPCDLAVMLEAVAVVHHPGYRLPLAFCLSPCTAKAMVYVLLQIVYLEGVVLVQQTAIVRAVREDEEEVLHEAMFVQGQEETAE